MRVLLIRHGKTKGNLERRYVGRTDEPILESEHRRLMQLREQSGDLTASERKYAEASAEKAAETPGKTAPESWFWPEIVYCSPMLRCVQTAEILFGARGARMSIDIHPGLKETDFGAFEYKNYEELKNEPAYQAWIDSGGTTAFPEGESGAAFRERSCRSFLECIQNALEKEAESVAFVVHGGTIMAVMEAFTEPKRGFYEWQIGNGEGIWTEVICEEPLTLSVINR